MKNTKEERMNGFCVSKFGKTLNEMTDVEICQKFTETEDETKTIFESEMEKREIDVDGDLFLNKDGEEIVL